MVYICNRFKRERARSSVGSEHLVYTQGVRGSNPFAPTSSKNPIVKTVGFFVVEALENAVFGRVETTKNEDENHREIILFSFFKAKNHSSYLDKIIQKLLHLQSLLKGH